MKKSRTQSKVEAAFKGKFKLWRIETGPSGLVYGVISSPIFVGLDDSVRQDRVWEVLRAAMSEEELKPVTLFVPLTPGEAQSLMDDAA